MYEQWTDVGGRRNKGTGTSDHPELLLPPGWEEAMADFAKEEEEVELSVTVIDTGSGISRDEVETILRKTETNLLNQISRNFQLSTGWEKMCCRPDNIRTPPHPR